MQQAVPKYLYCKGLTVFIAKPWLQQASNHAQCVRQSVGNFSFLKALAAQTTAADSLEEPLREIQHFRSLGNRLNATGCF